MTIIDPENNWLEVLGDYVLFLSSSHMFAFPRKAKKACDGCTEMEFTGVSNGESSFKMLGQNVRAVATATFHLNALQVALLLSLRHLFNKSLLVLMNARVH